MSQGITKLGNCVKCGKIVYADNIHGSPTVSNILLQSCKLGGDCEVDVLKTPWAKRNRFAD